MRRISNSFAFLLGASLLLSVLAGACAGESEPEAATVREIAESLMRDTAAVHLGLGSLDPTCPEVTETSIGTAWTCTAIVDGDRVVEFAAMINNRGQVQVSTTNVISSAAIPSFEEIAAAALSNSTPGLEILPESVDCGPSSLVLSSERTTVCALVDPLTRETYDLTLAVDDLEGRRFSLAVAETPRP